MVVSFASGCYKSQTFGKITEKNRNFVPKVKKITAMITLQITADTPEARSFFEHARTLPFIRVAEIKRSRAQRREEEMNIVREEIRQLAPDYPIYSVEELRAQIIQANEDIAAGRYITTEELERRMTTW
jgi:hypothetical protein